MISSQTLFPPPRALVTSFSSSTIRCRARLSTLLWRGLCAQIRQHRAHGGLVFVTAKLPPGEAFPRFALVKKLEACADNIHWLKI